MMDQINKRINEVIPASPSMVQLTIEFTCLFYRPPGICRGFEWCGPHMPTPLYYQRFFIPPTGSGLQGFAGEMGMPKYIGKTII